ncbi:MAG: lipid A export permease/ATP-binding protein MsbA [Gammaproteobacteria bacterium]|nr:lipid A export permease/ATP-binding protein MsbA [Gammaproteobacteria bacterium]
MPAATADLNGVLVYRRLMRYVVPYWRAFALATLGMILEAGAQTTFAALIKPFVDGSFVERDAGVIRFAPIGLVLIFIIGGIASYLSTYWMNWVARRVIKTLRAEVFEKLLRLPVAYFDSTPSGNLLSRLVYDVEQVAQASSQAITVAVRDSLTIVGLLTWMFYIDWMLACILLVGSPLIAHLTRKISRRFRSYSTRIQTSMADVTHIGEETIEGQRVVKIFSGQEYERSRFEEANERNRHLHMRMIAASAANTPVVQLVSATGAAVVIYTALNMLDTLTVGTFVSFIAAMMMLLQPIKRLTSVNASLQRGIAAAGTIFLFMDEKEENDTGTVQVERARGAIEYRDVHFRYHASGPEILKGVSFSLEPGKSIAFVGRSGSGKSTLVNLLPRFYELESGAILLDGIDVRDIGLVSLRDQISLVSQHITLFNDTIANNIAYGRLKAATREEIIAAAEAAHAMEFIRQLPEGLDTLVGENGVLLSGGQRQRLAIARALLKNAPVLILDEATSALDTASERHIQAALEKLMTNRSTLIIAHRLSTIERADRIVVMEQGAIVESGRHEELLARNGAYANLYRMQFADAPASAAV